MNWQPLDEFLGSKWWDNVGSTEVQNALKELQGALGEVEQLNGFLGLFEDSPVDKNHVITHIREVLRPAIQRFQDERLKLVLEEVETTVYATNG